MLGIFGNRNICVSREISKKFEEIYRGKIEDVLKEIENIKGEIVIVVEGNKDIENFDHITLREQINMYIEDGMKQMDAIKKVAKLRGLPKAEVYNEYHKLVIK